ncbi:MAG: HipA domain-containing protein [Bacteroidetes bacterium]|nr:HipA domain-containing protein [Bacteroidota bacterium]
MTLTELKYCPGTLAEGYTTYSPVCLKKMFGGKKISHILPYEPTTGSEQVAQLFIENRKRISISGVQEKLSILLDKKQLRLTELGEHGTHILKPIPRDVKFVDQVPANEHLTMQIAQQVYGINTAENAIVFFKDGTPAYLTKRFDIKSGAGKWGLEDFATLAGKTSENAGPNYKYDFSYEEMGVLIQQHVPAWRIEIEKYFSLVIFNYLYSNGDAHLKNFSLMESSMGDHFLSPAYDLLNTSLHVNDSDFALSNGLFQDDFKSESCKKSGHPSRLDFSEFGRRIGITERRVEKLIAPFLERQPFVKTLVNRSFLGISTKKAYLLMFNTKRNYLIH